MDTIVKEIPQIKEEIQKITASHRKELDNFPDVSAFSEEVKKELRQKYTNNAKDRALKELDSIKSDVELKKSLILKSTKEKKYPLTSSAVFDNEKLQIEILRQRADSLAMSRIDFKIVDYLKRELENKNYDFINYFKDAVQLNSDVSTELKNEMSGVFNEVDKITGIKELEIEYNLCNAYTNQIQIYRNSISENDSSLKFQLIYIQNDINKLESELIPTI